MDDLYENTDTETPFDDMTGGDPDHVDPERTIGDAADECRAILAAEDLEHIDEIPIVSPCSPMDVEVDLGDVAIAAKGRALVSLLARIEDKHAEKKEAMSVFKGEIEALEIERDGLADTDVLIVNAYAVVHAYGTMPGGTKPGVASMKTR